MPRWIGWVFAAVAVAAVVLLVHDWRHRHDVRDEWE